MPSDHAIQLESVITHLSEKRPIFHSEADFQHAIAWELHTFYPEAQIRLEVNVAKKQQHERLDILIRDSDTLTAIELKYKTRRLDASHSDEEFRLLNHGAQDIGRYDFIKDVVRLEFLMSERRCQAAFAIFLTNEPTYWNIQRNTDTNHAQFSLSEGRSLTGTLQWGPNTGFGTMKYREAPLTLKGHYFLKWEEYSIVDSIKPSNFRYLLIPIVLNEHAASAPTSAVK